ncbi:hypothetical protein JB92DRAFT_2935382 [Gautieria morchelliformis]|nr:hypothetical protein JB92DRAFT_2935382 [Gautieria morchelliformis]
MLVSLSPPLQHSPNIQPPHICYPTSPTHPYSQQPYPSEPTNVRTTHPDVSITLPT